MNIHAIITVATEVLGANPVKCYKQGLKIWNNYIKEAIEKKYEAYRNHLQYQTEVFSQLKSSYLASAVQQLVSISQLDGWQLSSEQKAVMRCLKQALKYHLIGRRSIGRPRIRWWRWNRQNHRKEEQEQEGSE